MIDTSKEQTIPHATIDDIIREFEHKSRVNAYTNADIMRAVENGADPAILAQSIQDGTYEAQTQTRELVQRIAQFAERQSLINDADATAQAEARMRNIHVRDEVLEFFFDNMSSIADRLYRLGYQASLSEGLVSTDIIHAEALDILSDVQARMITLQDEADEERRSRKELQAALNTFKRSLNEPKADPVSGEQFYWLPKSFLKEVDLALFGAERLDNPTTEWEEMGG